MSSLYVIFANFASNCLSSHKSVPFSLKKKFQPNMADPPMFPTRGIICTTSRAVALKLFRSDMYMYTLTLHECAQ